MSDPAVKFRRVHFTDVNDGTQKRAYVPATQPDADTADGHSSDTEDLYLGGGGGVVMMTVVEFHFDYLVCTPPVGSNVNVALEPWLRETITSQYIPVPGNLSPGEHWTYGTYTANVQSRIATGPDGAETEFITLRFLVGDVIPVWPCTGSGVSISGVELPLIAITGRHWGASIS